MDFVLLLLGLAGLWLGTEMTIRGSVSLASRLGVSDFVVGIVVLSIGSDLPELAIALDAAVKISAGGSFDDVIVGAALGSSLGQIGFVMGLIGLLAYLTLPERLIYRHGGILLGSIALLGTFGLDGTVDRFEGAALLLLYGVYIVIVLGNGVGELPQDDTRERGLPISIGLLAAGLVAVVLSADLTVSSAVSVARALGVDEAFVAIVLIGLGSSLPELSISVGAVIKGRHRMSVGNLIGSNVFDTLVPVGAAALVTDIAFNRDMLMLELPLLFLISAVVLGFFLRKRGLKRSEAGIVLAVYLGYVAFKLGAA